MSADDPPVRKFLTTFVLCVESGSFEAKTVLAVESLRKFGGRLAGAPVLVVTPRLGPPLTRKTLRQLADLDAIYVRWFFGNRYDWYPYTNKAVAAFIADEFVATEQVVWLDSDVLVVGELEQLVLAPNEAFAICSLDKNIGSSGPDDRNEAYWRALGDYYGVPVDRLPWVETESDHQRVRFRLDSGVYSFRCGMNFGKEFVNDIDGMFSSRIAYTRSIPFPSDGVALAFAVVKLGLGWRLLPMAYNYEIGPASHSYRREALARAKILHYRHALESPDSCRWVLSELESTFPRAADWLRERVPLQRRAGGLSEMVARRALREWRNLHRVQHQSACRVTVPE
jgi:hypothetical protein